MNIFHSCIYEGQVVHNRVTPKKNKFSYSVYMLYLDLDEIKNISQKIWLFGKNSWRPYSFFERDYLWNNKKNKLPLKERICSFLQENGIDKPQRVRLLTNVRTWGYVFNPVSFYFCFNQTLQLYHIVCEVTNTFKEQRYYMIPISTEKNTKVHRHNDAKHFYISPFVDSDTDLQFFFQEPQQFIKICIHSMQKKKPIVKTALDCKRTEISNKSMLRILFTYPHMTFKVVFLIHYQAIKLLLKKIRFFTKKEIDAKMDSTQKLKIVRKN